MLIRFWGAFILSLLLLAGFPGYSSAAGEHSGHGAAPAAGPGLVEQQRPVAGGVASPVMEGAEVAAPAGHSHGDAGGSPAMDQAAGSNHGMAGTGEGSAGMDHNMTGMDHNMTGMDHNMAGMDHGTAGVGRGSAGAGHDGHGDGGQSQEGTVHGGHSKGSNLEPVKNSLVGGFLGLNGLIVAFAGLIKARALKGGA